MSIFWKVASINFIVGLCGCGDKSIDAAKAAIERQLVDPSSVQYRDVKAFSEGVVCGSMNSKNRMGGYVGFKPFIYNGDDLGQVHINAALSQTALWCANDPKKRTTAKARLSNNHWIGLAVAEQLCADAQEPLRKQIICEMADSQRRELDDRTSPP